MLVLSHCVNVRESVAKFLTTSMLNPHKKTLVLTGIRTGAQLFFIHQAAVSPENIISHQYQSVTAARDQGALLFTLAEWIAPLMPYRKISV